MSTTSDEKKKANKRKELLSQNLYVPPEVQKKHTGRPMIHPTITCTMSPTQPARKTPTEKRIDRRSSTTQKLIAHDTIWDFGQFFYQDEKKNLITLT